MKKVNTVEEYISGFDPPVQNILRQIRKTLQTVAPSATEVISYQIPTFVLHGNLVHYAAFKNHIGFYPGPSGIKECIQELSGFRHAKGTIQFPLHLPVPYDLIRKITAFRVKENLEKSDRKNAGKKAKICKEGHSFFKTSECPVCPVCEKNRQPNEGILSFLGAPARRALEQKEIDTFLKLSRMKESELLALHGFGPSSIIRLRKALEEKGLSFSK